MKTPVSKIRMLNGFDDLSFTRNDWNGLLETGFNNYVFLTWEWQKAWWDAFGRGQLLLLLAEEEGKPRLLAPLFEDHGMIYFVGSGGSDYLDFIGDSGNLELLSALLLFATTKVEELEGFLFYHVPERSQSIEAIKNAALSLNWNTYNEGSLPAPFMEMHHAGEAIQKKSLLRHENWFRRSGEFSAKHLVRSTDILPNLPEFFEQHRERWKATSSPSLFADPKQCYFYTRLTELADSSGWLRFTEIAYNQTPIAFHFGFHYNNSFLWYKPTFDVGMAKRSPGEVLLRQLIILAMEEKAHIFDFGLGEEEFKKRFLTGITTVSNWGVYLPKSS